MCVGQIFSEEKKQEILSKLPDPFCVIKAVRIDDKNNLFSASRQHPLIIGRNTSPNEPSQKKGRNGYTLALHLFMAIPTAILQNFRSQGISFFEATVHKRNVLHIGSQRITDPPQSAIDGRYLEKPTRLLTIICREYDLYNKEITTVAKVNNRNRTASKIVDMNKEIDNSQIIVDLFDGKYVSLETNLCEITIENRPNYCDRGRYIVKVFSTSNELCVADGFPRYYFDFNAMMTEIKAWMEARKTYFVGTKKNQEETLTKEQKGN